MCIPRVFVECYVLVDLSSEVSNDYGVILQKLRSFFFLCDSKSVGCSPWCSDQSGFFIKVFAQ